ncbi:MAG: DUF4147 domain-containing protein [Thermoguttaceae bacterium]|jgi:hydroxypyruvate reductase|nr:DUF4147 domain-containing protein [Thermoguttaceae bacterium]
MTRSPDKLRSDAMRIWQAGVEAVRSDRLVQDAVRIEGDTLWLGEEPISLGGLRRIAVVGGGKAGAGMADAVEQILGKQLMEQKQLEGWINVPADCIRTLQRIRLHAARPAGVNEPRPEGEHGSREILRIVQSLGPDDLCLCLISGGGSALMPAPVDGITLADKLAVTRFLSAAGATINELNTVRKQLSRMKGGGLARACRAGRLVALIISDVLGDPLDVIASGATVPDDSSTPAAALAVLEHFDGRESLPPAVFEHLEKKAALPSAPGDPEPAKTEAGPIPISRVTNLIIGNNATAVDAAGREAERLGYSPAMTSATKSEGLADDVGRQLADMALSMRDRRSPDAPDCLITGGEPVVQLAAESSRGLGGRNQQLVLAALQRLADDGAGRLALLSGGTDGEDGPTDAAGALLDADVLLAAAGRNLDPADYLARNDAYRFFEPLGALIKTGPTHTNVCDLRVVVTATLPGRR